MARNCSADQAYVIYASPIGTRRVAFDRNEEYGGNHYRHQVKNHASGLQVIPCDALVSRAG